MDRRWGGPPPCAARPTGSLLEKAEKDENLAQEDRENSWG